MSNLPSAKSRRVPVHYLEPSGTLIKAGAIVPPEDGSIPARSLNANIHGVAVKLTWRYDHITSMLAADRESAEKLLAASGIKE